MAITVTRDRGGKMKHMVRVREHLVPADVSAEEDGEDAGPNPHDFYDAALGACKALTVPWYARCKGIPVQDIGVAVERDSGAAHPASIACAPSCASAAR